MSNSNIAGVVHKCLLAEVNVYFKTFVFTKKIYMIAIKYPNIWGISVMEYPIGTMIGMRALIYALVGFKLDFYNKGCIFKVS